MIRKHTETKNSLQSMLIKGSYPNTVTSMIYLVLISLEIFEALWFGTHQDGICFSREVFSKKRKTIKAKYKGQ